jgi:hypothetical protein
MVAQKLKKTHGTPVASELMAKVPAPRQTGYADTVLSKDQCIIINNLFQLHFNP